VSTPASSGGRDASGPPEPHGDAGAHGTPEADPAPGDTNKSWLNLPSEAAASLLAMTTVPLSLPPTHLPPWAVFISWAGTFAAGGPKADVLRKIAPVQVLGSFVAMLIVLAFEEAADMGFDSGWQQVVAQMIILFVLNSAMIFVGRVVPALSFVPGMFFGFATYFATYFGGFGYEAKNALHALWAAILMNAIGLLYAFLNVKFTRPADQHQ
jgi:hypothetical protein